LIYSNEKEIQSAIEEMEEISIDEVEARFEHSDAVMCCIFIYRF
jgi:hypothetical protein